ncbi:MAG: DUF4382 domain-containing protein [Planctomycetes bacterium]|nr:DUF4382 domain-containing protein [Planctomycetota bacterium]
MLRNESVALVAALAALASGCGGSSGGGGGTGTLDVQVTDAPFPTGVIVKAEIDVERVEAQLAPSGPAGPGPLDPFVRVDGFSAPETFDLLQLTNGVIRTLVNAPLSPGRVTHLRLYFTAARVELSDGRVLPLQVPSGAQTGLKVPLTPPAEVVGGFTTELLLDIDVSRSFVPQGDPTLTGDPGAYDHPSEITSVSFNPVARAVNRSTAGRVVGTVFDGKGTADTADDAPLGGATVRASLSGTDVAFTIAAADGTYALVGLEAGTYTITVEAAGFAPASATATVTAANATTMDVVLQP